MPKKLRVDMCTLSDDYIIWNCRLPRRGKGAQKGRGTFNGMHAAVSGGMPGDWLTMLFASGGIIMASGERLPVSGGGVGLASLGGAGERRKTSSWSAGWSDSSSWLRSAAFWAAQPCSATYACGAPAAQPACRCWLPLLLSRS
jgi:hypothetical protein